MERYTLTTDNDRCKLVDNSTTVTVEWQKGKFNETQKFSITEAPSSIEGEPALWLARICREIGDYLAQNHPDLVW